MSSIPNSVPLTGLIAPTDSSDRYPVIDPIYGIDGLRSVLSVAERDLIPNERRRAGMLVFVLENEAYFRLGSTLLNDDWQLCDLNPSVIPPSPIIIPVPSIHVQFGTHGDENDRNAHNLLFASWEASSDDLRFLDYNPQYWLFRYKKSCRKRSDFSKLKQWVHPSHRNGAKYIGSNFFTGEQYHQKQKTLLASGGSYVKELLPERSTEFNLEPEAGHRTLIELEPHLWFSKRFDPADGICSDDTRVGNPMIDESDLKDEFPFHLYQPMGRRRYSSNPALKMYHNQLFRLRIVIDNPNPVAKQNPKLYGAMSATFRLRLQSMNNNGNSQIAYRYMPT